MLDKKPPTQAGCSLEAEIDGPFEVDFAFEFDAPMWADIGVDENGFDDDDWFRISHPLHEPANGPLKQAPLLVAHEISSGGNVLDSFRNSPTSQSPRRPHTSLIRTSNKSKVDVKDSIKLRNRQIAKCSKSDEMSGTKRVLVLDSNGPAAIRAISNPKVMREVVRGLKKPAELAVNISKLGQPVAPKQKEPVQSIVNLSNASSIAAVVVPVAMHFSQTSFAFEVSSKQTRSPTGSTSHANPLPVLHANNFAFDISPSKHTPHIHTYVPSAPENHSDNIAFDIPTTPRQQSMAHAIDDIPTHILPSPITVRRRPWRKDNMCNNDVSDDELFEGVKPAAQKRQRSSQSPNTLSRSVKTVKTTMSSTHKSPSHVHETALTHTISAPGHHFTSSEVKQRDEVPEESYFSLPIVEDSDDEELRMRAQNRAYEGLDEDDCNTTFFDDDADSNEAGHESADIPAEIAQDREDNHHEMIIDNHRNISRGGSDNSWMLDSENDNDDVMQWEGEDIAVTSGAELHERGTKGCDHQNNNVCMGEQMNQQFENASKAASEGEDNFGYTNTNSESENEDDEDLLLLCAEHNTRIGKPEDGDDLILAFAEHNRRVQHLAGRDEEPSTHMHHTLPSGSTVQNSADCSNTDMKYEPTNGHDCNHSTSNNLDETSVVQMLDNGRIENTVSNEQQSLSEKIVYVPRRRLQSVKKKKKSLKPASPQNGLHLNESTDQVHALKSAQPQSIALSNNGMVRRKKIATKRKDTQSGHMAANLCSIHDNSVEYPRVQQARHVLRDRSIEGKCARKPSQSVNEYVWQSNDDTGTNFLDVELANIAREHNIKSRRKRASSHSDMGDKHTKNISNTHVTASSATRGSAPGATSTFTHAPMVWNDGDAMALPAPIAKGRLTNSMPIVTIHGGMASGVLMEDRRLATKVNSEHQIINRLRKARRPSNQARRAVLSDRNNTGGGATVVDVRKARLDFCSSASDTLVHISSASSTFENVTPAVDYGTVARVRRR
eukprot:CFRG3836T1